MNKETEIVRDIFFLYELSLSIGRSLDIEENCHRFIKTLLARKNYDRAEVFFRGTGDESDIFSRIYSFPRIDEHIKCSISPSELDGLLDDLNGIASVNGDKYFDRINTDSKADGGEYLLLRLKDKGLVKLYSSSRKDKISDFEINQLSTVMEIFATSIEACLHHKLSIKEIEHRIEVEDALFAEQNIHKIKSRFVAAASHQFRTPLAVIRSNSDLLRMVIDKVDIKEKEQLHRISSRIDGEISKMVILMNDLLDSEKVDEGAINVNKSLIDATEFVKDVVDRHSDLQEDGRQVNFQQSGVAKTIRTDPKLFSNALGNLISNALKYSNDSNPVVDLNYSLLEVRIKVSDTGIGIPQKEHLNLFQPFFRAENVGDTPGTGLGLSIAKKFIDLLGGKIEVASALNKGAAFTIHLPYS